MNSLLENEGEYRLIAFVGIFLIMATWETLRPYRQLRFDRLQRWPNQIGLIIVNGFVLRLIFPMAALGAASYAQSTQFGLFYWLSLPSFLTGLMCFILLDMVVYWQHVISHRLDWFWKLHRTHHADTDYDLTTGLRFHPIELVISMLIKMAAILILGAPVMAVLLFEIVLSGSAMFNHSNIRLPRSVEPHLRRWVVTPTMHRIHHSTHRYEHDTNYGFFLSVWDRWFGSYTDQSSENDREMPIGLKVFRESENKRLDKILTIPFRD